MNGTRDVQTLTEFQQDALASIARMKATHRPLTLLVPGEDAMVMQEAAEYQRLLDLAAQADPQEGLRQGLEDIADGRTYPAREVFAELRREYGI